VGSALTQIVFPLGARSDFRALAANYGKRSDIGYAPLG